MKINYSKIKQGWLTFAGYFYLYIVVSNLLGEILVRLGDNEKDVCYPYWGMFGTFSYNCKDILLYYAWDISIGMPRLFISIPATAVALIKWGLVSSRFEKFLEAGIFILISSPSIILIFIPGFFYWHKRSLYISWGVVVLYMTMFIYLGLRG